MAETISRDDQIKKLRETLAQLEQGPSTPDLKKIEDRLLARIQINETFLVNQMEDLGVALTFIVVAFMFLCSYVLYNVFVQVAFQTRCRCLEHFSDWQVVVKASKEQLRASQPVHAAE